VTAVSNEAPVIIEVAINGMTTRERNPHVPLTPDEIADCALRCIDAGASVIHTHNASMTLPPDEAAEQYAASWRPVLDARPDALLYPTQCLAPTMVEKMAHVEPLVEKAGLRIGLVDPGSVNMTWADTDGLPAAEGHAYVNTVAEIRWAFAACDRLRLGPSISIYEPTWLNRPRGYRLPVRSVVPAAGAGFVVVLCGEMQRMPGLGRTPNFTEVDIGPDRRTTGLF